MFDHTILLAHGSRDPQWVAPFLELEQGLTKQYTSVSLAFMELTSPNIEDAVRQAIVNNAKNIAVLPLFLATGRHLKTDVPELLTPLRSRYQVDITLLPAVGEQEEFRIMLANIVSKLLTQNPGAIGLP